MTGLAHPDDDRILELAYGELESAEAQRLRQHVDGCPRCREVLAGIAEVRSAVRRVPPEPAPARGLESLLAYGEQAAARARSHRRNVRWLGLLTLATAAGLAWVLVPERRGPAPAGSETVARADAPRPMAGMTQPSAAPAKAKVAEEPKAKDAEKRNTELDQLAVAKKHRPVREASRRDATAADEARAAGALASAAPESPPADVVAQAEPRQQAKKSESSGEEQAPATAGLRSRAYAAPAKVAAATPPAPPASSAPPASAVAPQMEKPGAPARAEVDGAMKAGRVSGAAGGVVADKGLETFGQAGAGAKEATSPSANAASESAEGKARSDRAAQEARLAEVRRLAPSATGDARKALLFEQCQLEAKFEMRASVVGTCSQVAREFPGTKEAQQAIELARGFSVQLPTPPDR